MCFTIESVTTLVASLIAAGAAIVAVVISYRGQKKVALLQAQQAEAHKTHEIAFSRLHGKRADIIDSIFQQFVTIALIWDRVTDMTRVGGFDNEIRDQLDDLPKKGTTLSNYISLHRIYFTEGHVQLLQGTLDAFGEAMANFDSGHAQASVPTKADREAFERVIRQKLGPVFDLLKSEFRAMLGVKDADMPVHPKRG